MASYFDEHGLKDPSEKRAQASPRNAAVSVGDLFTPRATLRANEEISQREQAAALAAHLANLRGRQAEGQGEEEWFQAILAQLYDEAGASGRTGPPPASKAFIDSLKSLSPEKIKKDEACPICADPLVGKEVDPSVALPCSHSFHRGCVTPWLELHNTCPVCRSEVPSDDPAWLEAQQERERAKAKAEESEEDENWMYG